MGNKKAMINLGIIYMNKKNTSVDIDKSAKYFNKAYKDFIFSCTSILQIII